LEVFLYSSFVSFVIMSGFCWLSCKFSSE